LLAAELAAEGLDDVVTLVRAPLAPCPSAWPDEDDALWYEQGGLRAAMDGCRVDLLIVDGPPARHPGRQHSRYPAVPFFMPMLADDYSIILDDIDRPGEGEVVKRWEHDLGITFERRRLMGGIAIGRPRATFNV
jgi:hypothetical protein